MTTTADIPAGSIPVTSSAAFFSSIDTVIVSKKKWKKIYLVLAMIFLVKAGYWKQYLEDAEKEFYKQQLLERIKREQAKGLNNSFNQKLMNKFDGFAIKLV